MEEKRIRTIVFLHPHFTIEGGAGRFVIETGKLLAEQGFRVIVLSIRSEARFRDLCCGKVEFVDIGGPLSSSIWFWLLFPLSVIRVFGALKKIAVPFVLFPQVFPANWWGFLWKLFHPACPTIWACQEPSAFIHSRRWIGAIPSKLMKAGAIALNPVLKAMDVWLAGNVDRVVVNSNFGKLYAQSVYGYSPEKIRITYPGADACKFSVGDFSGRRLEIVTVCRLSKFKNVDSVIRSLVNLKKLGASSAVLNVVGRGEAEEELKELTRSLGLMAHVRFLGNISDLELHEVLKRSRAFVLASVEEPFGIAPIEAMLCGTPAVVVGNGGPAETVENGKSGFYINQPTPEEIAEKVYPLLINDNMFREMSNHARARGESFSWDNTVREIKKAIEEVNPEDGDSRFGNNK